MRNSTELQDNTNNRLPNLMGERNGDDMALGISNTSSSSTPTHLEESKHSISPTKSIILSSDPSFGTGRKLTDKEQRECAVIGNILYIFFIF